MLPNPTNSILTICTGNICRSPMAEGVLRRKLHQANAPCIHIDSAGTSGWDHHKPTAEAVRACSEIWIDISSLRSAPISEQMIQAADVILAMEKYHINIIIQKYNPPAENLFLLGDFHLEKPGIEIKDPFGKLMFYYREALELICECVDGFLTD